jgi:hypothetical protein
MKHVTQMLTGNNDFNHKFYTSGLCPSLATTVFFMHKFVLLYQGKNSVNRSVPPNRR